jgi:hypothetical protein
MKINDKGLDINKTKTNLNLHQEEKDSKHSDHNPEKDHKSGNNLNKIEKNGEKKESSGKESVGMKLEKTTDENLRKGGNI